jgi:hypothetical protein
MKRRIVLLALVIGLVAGVQPVLAWRGGVFVGVGPLWYPAPYPFVYPPPAYVYPAPPVIIERPAPPVYVESPPPPAPQYWYYCEDPKGYYPYVPQCPRGWMEVVPQAPAR